MVGSRVVKAVGRAPWREPRGRREPRAPHVTFVTFRAAEIEVRESGAGFYDLAVTSRGVEEGAPFEETRVYKFNGREYVPSDTFR